jgi:hypothetical protein
MQQILQVREQAAQVQQGTAGAGFDQQVHIAGLVVLAPHHRAKHAHIARTVLFSQAENFPRCSASVRNVVIGRKFGARQDRREEGLP